MGSEGIIIFREKHCNYISTNTTNGSMDTNTNIARIGRFVFVRSPRPGRNLKLLVVIHVMSVK